jgi:hypothetical protein
MTRFEKIKRDCAGHYDKLLLFDCMLIVEGVEIELRCEIQFLARACYTCIRDQRGERDLFCLVVFSA